MGGQVVGPSNGRTAPESDAKTLKDSCSTLFNNSYAEKVGAATTAKTDAEARREG